MSTDSRLAKKYLPSYALQNIGRFGCFFRAPLIKYGETVRLAKTLGHKRMFFDPETAVTHYLSQTAIKNDTGGQ
jgi:hypothetical protein